ncbi:L-threonylcarbamoyladenylate synthase [Candidatus Phytoplasma oryzae]
MKKKIIIFPTDTVYGIGTNINDIKSLNKIYQIKERDINKPISILFFSLRQIRKIVFIDEKIKKIARFFWPGPLTLIVFVKSSSFLFKREKKIGIRIPNHPLALKILRKKGPFRVTSVNKSGEPAINNYQLIKIKFKDKVDYIYSNIKNLSSGVSSTVVDTTTPKWKILRKGEDYILKELKEFIVNHFH